ncbi:OmpA family protein [Weeksellaceae bacterium KMM 9724]|uniref:OmpA family protein n=1 Tax=Profundicola chukchiensis TaxID=2961959 RepID=UPI0024379303|nr:OmpA family protein [Profundicola chukchiensis]MDG4950045.1 OmpA family protein [Profundicola chukchiensis]
MKLKIIIALVFSLSISTQADAQIWKKVKKAAERGVERTLENRSQREASATTDDAIDTVLGKKKSKSKKSKTTNQQSPNNPQPTGGSLEDTSLKEIGVNEVGFVRGDQIIFQDDFLQDAIGDFPAKWDTNLGGDIKKLSGIPGKWLKVPAKSVINLELPKPMPANYTFEMDIILPSDVRYAIAGLGFSENKKGFHHSMSSTDGFGVMFYSHKQQPSLEVGNRTTGWMKTGYEYPFDKKVHVAIQVNNNERVRVYVDGTKVSDMPKVFKPEYANNLIINAMTHGDGDTIYNYFYFSNVVIAAGDTDRRSSIQKDLMEKGSFSSSDILFATGSDYIEPSSNSILNEVGELMQNSSDNWKLTIIGHTDSDGDANTNQKLSLDRASAVKKYLITKYNIDSDRINVVGKGESEPIASNSTSLGKAKNRRVEFKKQ